MGHREGLGAKQRVSRKKFSKPRRCWAALEPGKRNMRCEFAPLRLQADRLERRGNLSAQAQQQGQFFDSGPQDFGRSARRKIADPLKREIKSRRVDVCERVLDILQQTVVDIANEAKCEVKWGAIGPISAVYALAQANQAIIDGGRHIEGDKKTMHRL